MILCVAVSQSVEEAIAAAGLSRVRSVDDLAAVRSELLGTPQVDVVVVGSGVAERDALELTDDVRVSRPELGVVLLRSRVTAAILQSSLRSGVREVVRERDADDVVSAVRRASELSRAVRGRAGDESDPAASPTRRGVVVTVFSAKGGCGKTMLTTNMAAALTGSGQVTLVDLDLAFGDVGIALQLGPGRSIADAVPMGAELDESALRALLTPHPSGIRALLAPTEPAAADLVTAATVTRVLQLLRGMSDVVLVDTPASFADPVLAALDESDRVVLLATLEIPALKNLKLSLQTLDLLGIPRSRLEVVISRSDSHVGLKLSEVEKTLGMPVTAEIPSDAAVPSSLNRGVPLVIDQPAHPVSRAISALALRQLPVHPIVAATVPAPRAPITGALRKLMERSR